MHFLPLSQYALSRSFASLADDDLAVGVTIGNFDGLHRGHQGLMARVGTELEGISERYGARSFKILATFVPHPKAYFQSKRSCSEMNWHYLSSLRCKLGVVASLGFDAALLIRFTPQVANLSPDAFVEKYFVNALHARVVVVGYDWHFGKNREGNVETLRDLARGYGFRVAVLEPILLRGFRISSSRIKDSLRNGDLKQVKVLLGRPFQVSGVVVSGDKRGRDLGFPTANIIPRNQLLPPKGVYATTLRVNNVSFPAITNIGIRPTFQGEELVIETHLIDHSLSLYGNRVTVVFHHFVREEICFADKDSLSKQIKRDIEHVRSIMLSG